MARHISAQTYTVMPRSTNPTTSLLYSILILSLVHTTFARPKNVDHLTTTELESRWAMSALPFQDHWKIAKTRTRAQTKWLNKIPPSVIALLNDIQNLDRIRQHHSTVTQGHIPA